MRVLEKKVYVSSTLRKNLGSRLYKVHLFVSNVNDVICYVNLVTLCIFLTG